MRINSLELVQLAREGNTREYAAALKETGPAVLEEALDVYLRKGDADQTKQALQEILNLKNSLLTHVSRHTEELEQNSARVWNLNSQIQAGQYPGIQLNDGENQELSEVTALVNGQHYHRLARQMSAETTSVHLPGSGKLSGIRRFLEDLTIVQAAYIGAVPGDPVTGLAAGLVELRERLAQARVTPEEHALILAQREVHEWSRDNWLGLACDLGSKRIARDLVRPVVRPEVVHLPVTSLAEAGVG